MCYISAHGQNTVSYIHIFGGSVTGYTYNKNCALICEILVFRFKYEKCYDKVSKGSVKIDLI